MMNYTPNTTDQSGTITRYLYNRGKRNSRRRRLLSTLTVAMGLWGAVEIVWRCYTA